MVRGFLKETLRSMDVFLDYTATLDTYRLFNEHMREKKSDVEEVLDKLQCIQGETLNYRNLGQIGRLMKCFYEMYEDEKCNNTFLYVFGYHGYIEMMEGIRGHIRDKRVGFTTFGKKRNCFKKAYYGAHINTDCKKNDIKIDKSLVITGPNASGKTTTLKTALINVIMSQQLGCGHYEKATLQPFHYIQCYLNIPDTSGRDSLFQAEARRCKDIIDVIDKNRGRRHFCVFDELYSGTNPDEAVSSAIAFMRYITQTKGVKCILTTHFLSVCRNLDKQKNVENVCMETKPTSSGFTYTYAKRGNEGAQGFRLA